jgi:hypothetical protein
MLPAILTVHQIDPPRIDADRRSTYLRRDQPRKYLYLYPAPLGDITSADTQYQNAAPL